MANEEVLGPRKTMFVLVIVVGCFAVLWPRLLSPLMLGTGRDHLKSNQLDRDAALKQERSPNRGAGPHPALRERGRAIPPGTPPPARGSVMMPPHARVRSSPLAGYFELDIKPPPIPGMRPPLGSAGGPVTAPKSSMGFVMPIYTICIIIFFVYTLSKILFKRTGTTPYEPISPDPQFRRRVFRDDSRSSPDKLGPKERDTIVTAISGLVAEVQQQMEANYAQNHRRQDVQDNNTRPYTNGTILHNSGSVQIVASEYREKSREKSLEQKEPSPIPEEPEKPSEVIEEVDETLKVINDSSEIKESTPETEECTLKSVDIVTEDAAQESVNIAKSEQIEADPKPVEFPEESTEALEKESMDDVTEIVTEEPEDIEAPIDPEEPVKSELEKDLPETNVPKLEEDVKVLTEEIEAKEEATSEQNEDKDLVEIEKSSPAKEEIDSNQTDELIKLSEDEKITKNGNIKTTTDEFLKEELREESKSGEGKLEKQSTPDLLEEAIRDEEDDDDAEKSTVKVVGMETTAHSADGGAWPRPEPPAVPPPPTPKHEADEVQSIFLEAAIPAAARGVLVAHCAGDPPAPAQPAKHSPTVVSGKMTLSLIQDAPRETPERDLDSTVDDFTTASAVTQNAAEKGEELSDEEVEEEIEIEEIEEEVEEEEEEEELEPKKDEQPKKTN